MATIKYLLQSKSNTSQIYLRLSLSRSKSVKRKIGLIINYKDWSDATGLPKQNNPENKKLTIKLRKLSAFVLNEVNEASSNGIELTGNWLTSIVDRHFDRIEITDFDYLTNYGEYFIKNLKYKVTEQGKSGVSSSTHKKYRTIVNKLIAFQNHSGRKIFIKDVGLKFRSELIDYFSQVDNLSDNTIGRYLKFVKSICLDAQRNGIETNIQLEHFKGFTVKSPKVTLSFEEIELLKNKVLNNENHAIARDWLIIGCYTGQRVSDLLRINKGFVKKIQNFDFIVLEQMKTEKLVQIPIHFEVKKVLDKRGGDFPPKFVMNVESNKALFNRYLKQICKLAEINSVVEGNLYDDEKKRTINGMYEKHKLVSSHICRRSFATNFYGNPKYPTPLLMNITAHSTEKMFLEYIGKKPIDYGLQLAEIWAKEALKEKKKPQLDIIKNVINS